MTETLRNGTTIVTGPDWAVVTLPGGAEVHAHPNADSAGMAEQLGYGADVAAMTRDHDPLHARLTDWLGLPVSFSLSGVAGAPIDEELGWAEEAAVLAVQKFAQMARAKGYPAAPPVQP